MLVIFDLLGTLFSFESIRRTFRQMGVPAWLADWWIDLLFQSAAASTLAERYSRFEPLAESTLRHIFSREQVPEERIAEVLPCLKELKSCDDAEPCLRALRHDGHRLGVLTNAGRDEAGKLLRASGLWKWCERLYSADTARACKPCGAPYELIFRTALIAPYECCMVSAHGWDILGADSVGMYTVYVDRFERHWPFPGSPPGLTARTLHEVPFLISRAFGKPESPEGPGPGQRLQGEA